MRLSGLRYFIVLLFACALLFVREVSLLPDMRMHFWFFDVGQGDGALIVSPSGKQIVIDGGPDWKLLERLGRVVPFFDRSIDLVVLSHAHIDHIVSLEHVLRRYTVSVLLVTNVSATLPQYGELLELAKKRGVHVTMASAGDHIKVDDTLTLDVLWPPKHPSSAFTKDLNDVSIVLKASDGTHSALLTGDAEEIVERTLLLAKVNLQADLLKVGHHGSKTSSSTGFLLAVQPKIAVISSGIDNHFGHPNMGVTKRLETLGASVRRIDREGTIEVVWE